MPSAIRHDVGQLLIGSLAGPVLSPEIRSLAREFSLGGVTIFALPAELPIYVDDTLLECEAVILGGGSRSKKIKVAPKVFSRLPGASIVPGLSSG